MKYKHLLTTAALAILLAGCSFFKPAETPQVASSSSENDTSSSAPAYSLVTESSSQTSEVNASNFLSESIESDSDYTSTTLPKGANLSEINQGINDYYKANFPEADKAINYKAVNQTDLDTLQQDLDEDATLSPLKAKVDQITLQLDGKTHYVARVVVPMKQKDANQLVPESEITLMNHALANLGNRLILIAYYDSTTKQVTPANLSNSTTPLFYYDGE